MVRDGAPSLAPLRTGLQSVYACLAAKASAELGQFIDVRQVIPLGAKATHYSLCPSLPTKNP
jgi:hypothetical protein